jgi:Putative zincin peptidase
MPIETTPRNPEDARVWHDRTLPPVFVNVVGSMLGLGILLAVATAYILVWREGIGAVARTAGGLNLVVLVVGLICSIWLHEALHAFGFWLRGCAFKHIKIGVLWNYLMPYAHCKVPLEANAYRFALALPGVALGFIPAFAGIYFQSVLLAMYGAFMLATAVGDGLILWTLRGVAGRSFVRDHPSEPGCQVLE